MPIHSAGIDPKALIKLLYEWDEIDQAKAQSIWKTHRASNIDIVQACMDAGVRDDAVLGALGRLLGMETVQLAGMGIPKALIERVPASTARQYRIVPVRMDGKTLVVATADPDNLAALDDLKFMLQVQQVKPALASEQSIMNTLELYYGKESEEILRGEQKELSEQYAKRDAENELKETDLSDKFVISKEELDSLASGDAASLAEAAPVKKLLNLILLTGVKAQAADIHFEPFEDSFRIRNRIDGVLYEMLPVPKTLASAVVARVKVMAHLDIAERRLPQDGKIPLRIGDRDVDLRISTLPTMFGESVVIRILDRRVVNLDIAKIGFPDDQLAAFREVLDLPNGIVIVTGPTGSGKTTTLYSALSAVNSPELKIITTEDPVEYEIAGLVQVPVDDEVGRSFANCLRAILRQDPDIVLVGEVRDKETATIAIQASLTGHLVFTTLHTNDAPTAVTRLIDMGVEPFLLSATVECVCAQRLVRTICTKCKSPYEPSEEELLLLNINPRDAKGQRFYYGKGCDNCKGTGYRGRTALFELMDINDSIRQLIIEKASAGVVRVAAQRAGMRTLRESGVLKVFAGLTTIEEVARETLAGEE